VDKDDEDDVIGGRTSDGTEQPVSAIDCVNGDEDVAENDDIEQPVSAMDCALADAEAGIVGAGVVAQEGHRHGADEAFFVHAGMEAMEGAMR
jgi:hypothetical protein